MLSGLNQTSPAQYEPALTVLGSLLGADGAKPAGSGRCDSVWCWRDDLWLAIEAKSDHRPAVPIPHRDIRQANDQLRLLAADRQQPIIPPESATVIVSPKPAVDPDGINSAEAHVHVTTPQVIADLARDTADGWAEILAGKAGQTGRGLRNLITTILTRHSILPSQVRDRLTQQPVAPCQHPCLSACRRPTEFAR